MSETAPHEPGFDGTDTVWLTQPVQAYGDRIDKLVLRRPNGRDIRTCGMPFRFSSDGDLIMDTKVALAMVERLADVPTSTVDELAFGDILAVQGALMSFLVGSPSTSSTATTTSPGSGVETLRPSSRLVSPTSSNSSDKLSA